MATPIIPFNRKGIYGIASVGTPTVTATEVTFNFEAHPYANIPFNGALIVRITAAIPAGTTGTLPVFFKTGNEASVAVTKTGGVPLTAADIPSTGYYWLFYDSNTKVVEVFSAVV